MKTAKLSFILLLVGVMLPFSEVSAASESGYVRLEEIESKADGGLFKKKKKKKKDCDCPGNKKNRRKVARERRRNNTN